MLLTVAAVPAADAVKVTVDLSAGPLRTFVPAAAFGAGIDGHDQGATRKLRYGPNLRRMREVGFGPIS